jgi:hypothetical protein
MWNDNIPMLAAVDAVRAAKVCTREKARGLLEGLHRAFNGLTETEKVSVRKTVQLKDGKI